MKTMSMVARLSDCPENLAEARTLIDQLEADLRVARQNVAHWKEQAEADARRLDSALWPTGSS